MIDYKRWFMVCAIMLMVVACTETETVTETPATLVPTAAEIDPTADTATDSAYPVTDSVEEAYPVVADAYPIFDISPQIFKLDPVAANTTSLTGIGEANIPIQIVSVTNMGEPLGTGLVNSDGTFTIVSNRAIDAGEKVGIQFQDAAMIDEFGNMEGSNDIPLLGYMLDIKTTTE